MYNYEYAAFAARYYGIISEWLAATGSTLSSVIWNDITPALVITHWWLCAYKGSVAPALHDNFPSPALFCIAAICNRVKLKYWLAAELMGTPARPLAHKTIMSWWKYTSANFFTGPKTVAIYLWKLQTLWWIPARLVLDDLHFQIQS